jgi:hypothetical protein
VIAMPSKPVADPFVWRVCHSLGEPGRNQAPSTTTVR